MSEGYFTPWRDAPERACRTCAASIGTPDGWHLWCERHRLVLVYPCAWWERAPGADDAEGLVIHAALFFDPHPVVKRPFPGSQFKSTRPKTLQGKAEASRNTYKGATRRRLGQLHHALRNRIKHYVDTHSNALTVEILHSSNTLFP